MTTPAPNPFPTGNSSFAGDLAARLTAALLAEPWNSWPKSAHGEHRFDSGCAICQCDVVQLATWATRFLAAEIDRSHALCGASARFPAGPTGITGPCILRHGHDGPVHQDVDGVTWAGPLPVTAETRQAYCPPDQPSGTGKESFPVRDLLRRALKGYDSDIDARAVDALVPVVEAWAAEQTQRADDRAEAAGYEATSARLDLREAERERDEARDLLREFVSDIPCHLHSGNGYCGSHFQSAPCPNAAARDLLAGVDQDEPLADWERELLERKDREQEALFDLIRVAAYVSRGRRFVDVEPYPDALARKALGALDDATLHAALDPKDIPDRRGGR